ncbi:MAG: magnesium transporter [Tissierellia bacterium]|nr:magnesium transporter [Tissierellia bacterium]
MEKEDIIKKLDERDYKSLKKYLIETNEADLAEIIEEIDSKEYALIIFRMLPKEFAVDVFSYLDVDTQVDIASAVSEVELKHIVDELYFDDMIDLLEEMPVEFVDKVLEFVTPEKRKLVNEFLKYPEYSAGSIMTIEYVSLNKNFTVREAMDYIRKVGLSKETIYTCYVTTNTKKLIGIVSLRKLVTSNPDEKIVDLMEEDMIYINTNDDQEDVADKFKRYGFLAMPVVDAQMRLVGIITVDDIIDVMEDEATEDFQKMAAMTPTDESYLDTSVFTLARHRLPWLLILMVTATLTGGIIKKYDDLLGKFLILSTFIPMLTDTGGNAGSQSSTLVIRGLATGDIKVSDFFKVVFKEFRISLICGITLAFINFLRLVFISGESVLISLTVCTTLIFTVMMSKVLGGVLPIAAKKMNFDPAIMAGPLITTVVDTMSLAIYFRVASLLLF